MNDKCEFHSYIDLKPRNDTCYDCGFHSTSSYKICGLYGTEWRENREKYKSVIILDKPGIIPERCSEHLRTDFSRLLYKQAVRLANFAVENRICKEFTNHYSTTGTLQVSLDLFPLDGIDEDKPFGIHEQLVIDSLEEIYRKLCYHLDLECIKHPEYVFKSLPDIHDKMCLMELEYGEKRAKIQNRIEELKSDENAETVNGYPIDKKQGICTCPGFKYRGKCKHLVAE